MYNNILDFFADTAARYPNKTAVVDGGRAVTFAELAWQGQKLGAAVSAACGGAIRKPVGVLLPKSIESVTADLACVWTGNAYMNLDVKTPAQRICNTLAVVRPLCVITDHAHAALCAEACVPLLYFEDIVTLGDTSGEAPVCEGYKKLIGTDPLCLINTSGSTGTPKSVVLNHASFIDYTTWGIETMHLSPDEVVGSMAPIVFDHSSYEFCLMLIHGCTLDFIPESYPSFPARLLQYMAAQRITYIFWVPTIMVNIANMDLLSRIPLPDVHMVWFAGEVFPTKQFNYWRRHLPQATFVNLYGPTEITVDCTYYVVERELADDEPIPIGYPRRENDILILNEKNEPAAPGEEGELCVRGPYLAMGYYNNPEKTAAAFVQNPLNKAYPETIYRTGDIVFTNERGEIVYRGRNDSLIKHMGKRIELGEIEHVIINSLKLVRNGCAVYDYGKKQIVFYYEADGELDAMALRREIGKELPAYMIPTRYICMQELPRNTNGKIDRLQLKNLANK